MRQVKRTSSLAMCARQLEPIRHAGRTPLSPEGASHGIARRNKEGVLGDAMNVRDAEAAEIDQLAGIWYDAWQDAHAQILPAELARIRTLDSFRDRLRAALPNVRVVGAPNAPVGFCIVAGDELYQLFVSAQARGTGAAVALVADAESRLGESGVEIAWLACAIGNERAARFYEKCGWHRAGIVTSHLDTPEGIFPLQVWRYEKHLRQAARLDGASG